jgi:hypothetical protein
MSLTGFLKRTLTLMRGRHNAVPLSETTKYRFDPLTPEMHELVEITESEIRDFLGDTTGNETELERYERIVSQFRNNIASLLPETITALIKAKSAYEDFRVMALLSPNHRKDEAEVLRRALFHEALRDYKLDWYYLDLVLERMSLTDERFTACTYSELDEVTMKQAIALFRVIAHFIQYRGFPSTDTSTFLREEPEMADKVIEYIERRGIGMNGFDMELFKQARETSVTVLDSGVL